MNTSKRASGPTPARKSGPTLARNGGQSKGHVLVIALIGFVVGVVWPRLAGVSLVPEAPVEQAETLDDAENADPAPAAASAPEPGLIELLPEDRLGVSPVKLTSCAKGEDKSSKCDAIKVDDLLHPHLIALLGCPASEGLFGTLSLGFKLDFVQGKVLGIESGRSTDLPEQSTKELLRCAERELSSVALNTLQHQYDSYQVFYLIEFKTPEAAAQDKTSVTAASGKATVRWRTALIRKEPERDGQVVARLLTGAVVVVTGRMGEWYRVKYDDKGREGWVHGAAVGLDKQ